jgi:hypothetical protein
MEASLLDMVVTPGQGPVPEHPPERGVERIVGMPQPW